MLHTENDARTFRDEPISSVSTRFLAPDEPRAPTALLSAAERSALVACLADGALCKQRNVWVSPRDTNTRFASITVAKLAREGMLRVSASGRRGVARLTPRGSWFARTAASA